MNFINLYTQRERDNHIIEARCPIYFLGQTSKSSDVRKQLIPLYCVHLLRTIAKT